MMPLKVMPSSGCNWDINKSGGVTHSDPIFFFFWTGNTKKITGRIWQLRMGVAIGHINVHVSPHIKVISIRTH